MSLQNFYTSNNPGYFWHQGKPHYNYGNEVIHSNLYKKLNPIRQRYDYQYGEYTQMPFFFGHIPQLSWVYGNLDYSFNKHHRHYQAHDDWYPDRKGKTLGVKNGGQANPNMKQSKFMALQPQFIPKGCYREIRKYQACTASSGKDKCFNEKISIMEVCPDHVLEGLRERRKWYLRAEAIDNETYKRAMTIGDYNNGRSVSDLDVKDWSFGHPRNLRSESTWQDDRYDPRKYPHPHRYDNINFPEQEFKDVFGGTVGTAEQKATERHQLGFNGNESTAMQDYKTEQRKNSFRAAKDEVNKLNSE